MLIIRTYHQSSQGSIDNSLSSHSIQVIHYVFNNVLEVYASDRASVPKWMEYMHYHIINELCDDLQFELEYIHDCSEYIVNGQNCEQKISTMNKIWQFISWMSTRKKETKFQFSSEYLLSLTEQDFNKIRQEAMIRISEE